MDVAPGSVITAIMVITPTAGWKAAAKVAGVMAWAVPGDGEDAEPVGTAKVGGLDEGRDVAGGCSVPAICASSFWP